MKKIILSFLIFSFAVSIPVLNRGIVIYFKTSSILFFFISGIIISVKILYDGCEQLSMDKENILERVEG